MSTSDVENAHALARLAHDRIRYLPDLTVTRPVFRTYDGEKWVDSDQYTVRRMIDELSELYEIQATLAFQKAKQAKGDAAVEYENEGKRLIKASRRLLNTSGRSALMVELRTVESIVASADDFDTDPLVINCRNGLLNLKTMQLEAHHPDHLVTRSTSVEYHPIQSLTGRGPRSGPAGPDETTGLGNNDMASPYCASACPSRTCKCSIRWESKYSAPSACPNWISFLQKMIPDPNVRRYLQKLAGYFLSGLTTDQSLYLLLGTGSNGKSTFVETIADILGDYSEHISIETILDKGGSPHELAQLPGSRLVTSSEVPQNNRLNEALIKSITGGEEIRARALYQNSFTFLPSFKLLVSLNTLPRVTDVSEGMWRRLKPIDWPVSLSKEERNPRFREDVLKPEYEAVFAWMVDGWQLFRAEGLNPPGGVIDTLDAYREDSDPSGDWFRDSITVTSNPADRVPVSDVYTHYSEYCDAKNVRSKLSKTNLTQYLRRQGIESQKSGSTRYYTNLKISKNDGGTLGFTS